jgi:hypothetical protein
MESLINQEINQPINQDKQIQIPNISGDITTVVNDLEKAKLYFRLTLGFIITVSLLF